jgi:outer membrane scaffolding protein for murein synthesis (MipA/OmpV family)
VHVRLFAGAALALLAAAPAWAADPAEPAGPAPSVPQPIAARRNSVTIGLGAAWLPTYEGSNDYSLTPVVFAFGKVAGIGFATRGTTLYFDVIPSDTKAPFSFEGGPVGNLRLDRSRKVVDRQVSRLGKIGPAVELGFYAGVTKNRVLHGYDTLNLRVAVTRDVTDTHGSTLVSPSVEYMTPVSHRTALSLSASADHVGTGFAQTYYGIDAAGSARSGLPVYEAEGGWKSWRINLVLAHVLSGDLENPHLSAFAALSYSRVLGDFARSPVVALVGDPDQYAAGGGLAYSF